MILIDEILVDESIATTHFLCDLSKCKGACCTVFGTTGAPLLDEEIDIISSVLDKVKPYLDKKSISYIENKRFYQGKSGNYSTNCIKMRDCVFVYYKGNDKIAYCAIEQAFLNSEIEYKKPISCHLFPIRVGDFGGTALYYEKMSVCKPALYNGKENNFKIYDAVKESIIRAYGIEWYNKFVIQMEQINSQADSKL